MFFLNKINFLKQFFNNFTLEDINIYFLTKLCFLNQKYFIYKISHSFQIYGYKLCNPNKITFFHSFQNFSYIKRFITIFLKFLIKIFVLFNSNEVFTRKALTKKILEKILNNKYEAYFFKLPLCIFVSLVLMNKSR